MGDDKNSIADLLTLATTSQNIIFTLSMPSGTNKALAHDLIPASLCEEPIFYFNVESPSFF